MERAKLYTRLSRRCASQIGDLCLRPPGDVTLEDITAAFLWYARSDTPVADVWSTIKSLQPITDTGWNEALLNYLEATLLIEEQDTPCLLPPPPLFNPKDGLTSEKVEVVLELARLFAEQRRDKLPDLVLSLQVPWSQDSVLRQTARELLGDSDSVRTKLALLALEAWDMKSLLELQGNVQVDKMTNTATVDLPGGFQQHMDQFLSLSQGLEVDDIVRICRYAHEVIVKSLPVQGLSLVVKGPLFDHLEAHSPQSLAQLLAQMTHWGQNSAFDVIQVLIPLQLMLACCH